MTNQNHGEGLSPKEFFESEWYSDGLRQLCADGWPTFVVPVNIQIRKLISEYDKLKEENNKLKGEVYGLTECVNDFNEEGKNLVTCCECGHNVSENQTEKEEVTSASIIGGEIVERDVVEYLCFGCINREIKEESQRLKQSIRDMASCANALKTQMEDLERVSNSSETPDSSNRCKK